MAQAPDVVAVSVKRYSESSTRKSSGTVYTPKRFADFAAEQMLSLVTVPNDRPTRLLDPACGDGSLLLAMLERLPVDKRARLVVHGFDTDVVAVQTTIERIRDRFPDQQLQIEQRDFLEYLAGRDVDLFSASSTREQFDLVIANPPYVRTQVLGAAEAARLATRFGLTGRVDLYYPFVLGIGEVLAPHGVAGIIVSNRFMTTRSGQAIRSGLRSAMNIRHVWDLGDTRLFDAAVLPAFVLATGKASPAPGLAGFSTIYGSDQAATASSPDPLTALEQPDGAVVRMPDGQAFAVKHGQLSVSLDRSAVWRLSGVTADRWLQRVADRTWGNFSRIGKIKVGVKTTADRVFIRSDWDQLPAAERPELLRPLTTRHCARRFRPLVDLTVRQILYPHESGANGRAAVDLRRYPKSARYLEQHRAALEAREYVISAGRQWYEIWVPHDPEAWAQPKLVFPDISEKPVFWLDESGSVVNGECYWMRCEHGADPEWLWLALAVANSTFIESFYDRRFNNKLYAGRRRFITQYVEQFPLPDPASGHGMALIEMAQQVYAATPSAEADAFAQILDRMVWAAFGFSVEEVGR